MALETDLINKELLIQNIIKEQTDFLIHLVDGLEGKMKEIFKSNNRSNELEKANFGSSQVRNLLNSVNQASGVKEISLYIQYQMGRDEWKNSWSRVFPHNHPTLGDQVIDSLKKIEEVVENYKFPFAKKDNENEEHTKLEIDKLKNELLISLIERYFLFWSWKYTYLAAQYKQNNQKQKHYSNKKGGRNR